MNRRRFCVALLVVSISQFCQTQQTSKTQVPADLERELSVLRQKFPGDMAIYMKNLANGDEIALDADSVYETFSVIKLAIASEVLYQSQAGKFSLSDRVTLKAGDRRLPSGVLYALDPGLQPTIKDLLTLMIIISDNEATDLLGDKVGRANVTAYMRSLGLDKTTIQFSDLDWDRTWLSTLDPSYKSASGDKTIEFPFGKYDDARVKEAFGHTIYDAGIYFGHSSAREIGHLLESAAEGKLVSKAASQQLLDIMEMQQVNDRFPRYLRDVRIAHKTGDGQPFIANDAGVLWVGKQPIVLVVFTGHHRGETAALHDTIARVAAMVVQHYGGQLAPDYLPATH
jgi:beta-lactamase class A